MPKPRPFASSSNLGDQVEGRLDALAPHRLLVPQAERGRNRVVPHYRSEDRRASGRLYTRILKTGFRLGDAADMCIIEFVDFNDAYTLGIAPAAAAEASPRRAVHGKPAAKKTD